MQMPSLLKAEPWQGQSKVFSSGFHCTRQPCMRTHHSQPHAPSAPMIRSMHSLLLPTGLGLAVAGALVICRSALLGEEE